MTYVVGKTKRGALMLKGTVIEFFQDDVLTAKDGKKKADLPGKGVWATRTNHAVMGMLERHGIPMAYVGQGSAPNSFITRDASMIAIEVVVRRTAPKGSSYLERNPNAQVDTKFEEPVVEMFLKTTGGKYGELDLGLNDPLLGYDGNRFVYYDAHKPVDGDGQCLNLEPVTRARFIEHWKSMQIMAVQIFEILEAAWSDYGGELQDFKVEFGLVNSELVLADVIDCDSWRVMWNGIQLSKQTFRDDVDIKIIRDTYVTAAAIVENFVDLVYEDLM